MLVPNEFYPPDLYIDALFCFRKLCAKDVYLDYMIAMSNRELIRKTRGGEWPSVDFRFEDNLIDLAWHQREFEYRRSFAYAILTPDQLLYLGCAYFYPPNWRKPAPKNADIDVSFWICQEAYDQGLYSVLYQSIHDWITNAWPFRFPFWTNDLLP